MPTMVGVLAMDMDMRTLDIRRTNVAAHVEVGLPLGSAATTLEHSREKIHNLVFPKKCFILGLGWMNIHSLKTLIHNINYMWDFCISCQYIIITYFYLHG